MRFRWIIHQKKKQDSTTRSDSVSKKRRIVEESKLEVDNVKEGPGFGARSKQKVRKSVGGKAPKVQTKNLPLVL